MTPAQARKLAIATMQRKIKALAFDAALYEKFGARTHSPTRAFRERERLKQAVEVLRKESGCL